MVVAEGAPVVASSGVGGVPDQALSYHVGDSPAVVIVGVRNRSGCGRSTLSRRQPVGVGIQGLGSWEEHGVDIIRAGYDSGSHAPVVVVSSG